MSDINDEDLTPEELEAKAAEEAAAKEETEKRKASLAEEHKELIAALVAEELKTMKANLDKAYKARDEAAKKAASEAAKLKELETKRLKDEGKHLEVAQLRIAELEETEKTLRERLVSVERDRELDNVLSPLDFQSDFARESAFRAILSELVQDEDGSWVHKSGASLSDYVKAFAKDPQKAFLFKPKNNNGSGIDPHKSPGSKGRPTSLKGLSTEEILKQAREGNLGSFSY